MPLLEIRLEAGKTVSGRVVDEGNNPIAGASIQLEIGPFTQAIGPPVTSGQDGRFQIEGIPKTFVYDRNGKLVAQSIDMRTRGQFLEMLAQAGVKRWAHGYSFSSFRVAAD